MRKDRISFFRQFLLHPGSVGAVLPSSHALAQTMVDWIDWPNVHAAAEFGPGTGVFTQSILSSLAPGAKFVAIEANPQFVQLLQQRYPNAAVYHDSVGNVQRVCEREQIERLDAILCGLPWASFSNEDQMEFLTAMMAVLKPNGQFATFAYLQGLLLPAGQRFRRLLAQYFSKVERSGVVWRNLPPAFVYRCRR